MDISLPSGVRFDQPGSRIVVHRGSYAAWWITRLGESPSASGNHAGAVRWVDGDDRSVTYPSSTLSFRSEPLTAGLFRLYVASDGEATIDVPAPGLGRSLTLRPTRRTSSAAFTHPLTVLPGGVVADDNRTALALPRTALAVSSVRTVAESGVTAEGLTACLTKAGGSCTGPTTAYGHTSSLTYDHSARLSAIYLPGRVPAGTADAVQRAQAGPRIFRASASVFYLVTVP